MDNGFIGHFLGKLNVYLLIHFLYFFQGEKIQGLIYAVFFA